jgi:fatty acid desaturase
MPRDDQAWYAHALGLKMAADIRTIAIVSTYFILTALAWSWHEQLGRLGSTVAVWVLMWFSFCGATTVHNTMHCAMFKSRHINKVFQVILSHTYGHPVSSYVPGHNLR